MWDEVILCWDSCVFQRQYKTPPCGLELRSVVFIVVKTWECVPCSLSVWVTAFPVLSSVRDTGANRVVCKLMCTDQVRRGQASHVRGSTSDSSTSAWTERTWNRNVHLLINQNNRSQRFNVWNRVKMGEHEDERGAVFGADRVFGEVWFRSGHDAEIKRVLLKTSL